MKIFDIHDALTQNWNIACKKFCSDCCTDHVLMTGLEGSLILEYLKSHNQLKLLNRILTIPSNKRFHPKTTINQEAYLATNDKPVPEPEDAPIHICPFLIENQCEIYPVRPMICRSMVSSTICKQTGQAAMSSFQMSVATLFFQYIEMLDIGGCYGNYLSVLEMLTTSPETQSLQLVLTKSSLLKNQRIYQVMMPPEYQKKLIPIMEAIQNIFSEHS